MSLNLTLTKPSEPAAAGFLSWLAVVAVALGTFAIVTTEMLPVGMLPLIGSDLHISNGAGGQAMTLTSMTAFASAPAILLAAGRVDRRLVMASMMVVLLAANVITVAADNLALLVVARVMVGISIGGFWAVGAGLAVRLVPEGSVPRASSIIMSGVAIASVAGVPAGTLIGNHAGWRAAFAVMAVLSLLVFGAVIVLLPPLPSRERLRFRDLTDQLRDAATRVNIVALMLVVMAHFAAYTYVVPVLEEVAGLDPAIIAAVLMVYGAAGVVGSFAAGWLAKHRLHGLVVGSVALTAAVTLILPLSIGTGPATVLLIVWGLAYGAVPVGFQVWMLRTAPNAEAASAFFVAVFQLAIGAGAVLGGLAMDVIDHRAAMWVGTGFAGIALVLVAAALRHRRG